MRPINSLIGNTRAHQVDQLRGGAPTQIGGDDDLSTKPLYRFRLNHIFLAVVATLDMEVWSDGFYGLHGVKLIKYDYEAHRGKRGHHPGTLWRSQKWPPLSFKLPHRFVGVDADYQGVSEATRKVQ